MAPHAVTSSSGYKGGRIVQIKLANFLTYAKLKLYPTAGLNLLIGPNGSGKSSIVCAICLGLAGKPTFTGRQIRLADYIKNGCQTATIELVLDDPEKRKKIVIVRTIKKNGSSTYMLNGKHVNEHDVELEVSRFNIQVNNLCMFLPQERVSDFSRMTPKQLLKSMLQAVGDHEMYKGYKELVRLRESARNCESRIKEKKEYIDKERQKNEMIEADVKLFEERQNNLKKISQLETVRPLFQYQEMYGRVKGQKEIKLRLAAEVAELERKLEPLETERNFIHTYFNTLQQNLTSQGSAVNRSNSLAERVATEISKLDQKISDVRGDLRSKLQEAEDQKRIIKDYEDQIAGYQNEYTEAKKVRDQMLPELEKVRQEKAKIKERLSEINSKLYQLRPQVADRERLIAANRMELQKLNDIRHKKEEILMKVDRHTYEATLWLRQNHNLFKGRIYEPVFTLIETMNRDCVKYIENHISSRDLIVFLCEDKEDTKKFTKILREEKNLAINAALVPERSLLDFQPHVPLETLRNKFHFNCYLKDLFQAPEAVVSFLCENYYIHITPVGDANTEVFLQQSGLEPPFKRYYTTNTSYSVKNSRYGSRNTSTSIAEIREKGILSPSANSQERQQEIIKTLEHLAEQLKALKEEEAMYIQQDQALSKELERIRKFEKDFMNQEDVIKNHRSKIAHKQNLLQSTKARKFDVNEEKRKAAEKIKGLCAEKHNVLTSLHMHLKDGLDSIKKKAAIRFKLSFCMKKKRELDARSEDGNREISKKRHELQEAANKYQALKKEAVRLKDSFDSETTAAHNRLVEEYNVMFSNMDELEVEISRLKAKVNCMTVADQAIIDEHAKRKFDIMENAKDLSKAELELDDVNEAIATKKAQWVVPLENLVEKISKTFSSYFESLGCVGEISLNKSENPEDFDEYGLSIRVKYRGNAPLKELSQAHHSGGECNVATIIFILSLQEQTEVPFRCVDEINQGMDSVNERKIFELVSASAEKCSQYFLLTPKLLPGLAYSSGMKIHIIHNGPALEIDHWNLNKIIKLRREAE